MPNCAAVNCSNQSGANVSFFRFPLNNKHLLERWLIAMKRNEKDEKNKRYWKPTENSRICSNHFTDDCFTQNVEALRSIGWPLKRLTLKADAVPTVFDFSPRITSTRTQAAKRNATDSRSIPEKGERMRSDEEKRQVNNPLL